MYRIIDKLIENKPVQCSACGEKLYYLKDGRFYCRNCGHETLDDLGKVKAYIQQHGEQPIMFIAQATGVAPEIIEFVIRDSNVEIPKDSKYFLACEKCGCSIKIGNFCNPCIRELAGGIKNLLREDMRLKNNMAGRMHIRDRF